MQGTTANERNKYETQQLIVGSAGKAQDQTTRSQQITLTQATLPPPSSLHTDRATAVGAIAPDTKHTQNAPYHKQTQ